MNTSTNDGGFYLCGFDEPSTDPIQRLIMSDSSA